MALIGNRSVLHKSPGRFLSGTVASGDRSNFGKAGMLASRFQALSYVFAGMPGGHLSPSSWSLPRTAGAMSSSREAALRLDSSGLAVGGVTTSGEAALGLAAAGVGQLIAFGQGSASITLTSTGTATGVIQAAGTATFTLAGGTPTLGAIASGGGAALLYLDGAANVLPADDTPPARTGTASLSLNGSATLRAIGRLSGSTQDASQLTPGAIADAVWSKVLTP